MTLVPSLSHAPIAHVQNVQSSSLFCICQVPGPFLGYSSEKRQKSLSMVTPLWNNENKKNVMAASQVSTGQTWTKPSTTLFAFVSGAASLAVTSLLILQQEGVWTRVFLKRCKKGKRHIHTQIHRQGSFLCPWSHLPVDAEHFAAVSHFNTLVDSSPFTTHHNSPFLWLSRVFLIERDLSAVERVW